MSETNTSQNSHTHTQPGFLFMVHVVVACFSSLLIANPDPNPDANSYLYSVYLVGANHPHLVGHLLVIY